MSKGRIVYVDDDLELTRLLQITLEDEGYEVFVANEGEEGLGTILEEQPDLVILDVMMPGLNGWELARYLREREEKRSHDHSQHMRAWVGSMSSSST